MSSLREKAPFLAIFILLVLADQITKAWVTATMNLHESIPVIPGLFSITYVRNPGAAFGFLAGASPTLRLVFFVAVTLLAIGLILYSLFKAGFIQASWRAPLVLILSGALGNLVDRVRFGEVVDFLDIYVGSAHWPAFNVADSAITVGAVLLTVLAFRSEKNAIKTSS
ncbi:MAG: signal peptidase II [Deltaproteobacteria bacterium HGW-Deltaproteobacteria-19]|jgi:signal peptidase II|nr:MAG: signal peptidase II [Deltaproteobacteria bacterium HGW-Deltaproteobacteria-19]